MASLVGKLLGSGGTLSASAPSTAPTIALVSVTTTSITVLHTPPSGDADYVQTRFFIAADGSTPTSSQTSTLSENVAFTGLTAGTAYSVWAVSEGAGDLDGPRSTVLRISTSASGTSQADKVVGLLQEALEGLADAPTVYVGRIWPHNWEAPYAALVRFDRAEAGDGHGGAERREYEATIMLRYRVADSYGETRQNSLSDRALLVRAALHLVDPSSFSTVPTGLHLIEVDSPIDIPDSPDDPDEVYLETAIVVRMTTFEIL